MNVQQITTEADDLNPSMIHLVRDGEYVASVFDAQGIIPGRGRYEVMQAPAGCEKFYADLDDLKRDITGEPKQDADDVQEWGSTMASMLLHKMHGEGPATHKGADYRARCNKSIRWYQRNISQTEGPRLRSRREIEQNEHAHLYAFCPRCEAK